MSRSTPVLGNVERDGGHLGRPPRQQRGEPGSMLSAVEFGIADHGQRAGREQAPQISVASFAPKHTDISSLLHRR